MPSPQMSLRGSIVCDRSNPHRIILLPQISEFGGGGRGRFDDRCVQQINPQHGFQ
jgi:hypothetical protein